MSDREDAFRRLQKHLDKMPVGYPSTRSGVEISLLNSITKLRLMMKCVNSVNEQVIKLPYRKNEKLCH
jgi:hypothetical protein